MTTAHLTANQPIRTSRDIEAEVAERFRKDTAGHELRILHDDGLYRHLLVRNPRSSMYWFEILTWPGSLSIRGDMGSGYVFSRERDMFPFFRSERGGINAHYWSEKLSGGRDSVQEYSEHVVRQRVVEAFVEDARWNGVPHGLGKALRTGILNRDLYFEDEARALLENFEFKGYSFDDLWEWDLRDFDPAFLWCCHAIVAGIAQYDRATKVPPRLRSAWESARRGRAQLRARVAELEAGHTQLLYAAADSLDKECQEYGVFGVGSRLRRIADLGHHQPTPGETTPSTLRWDRTVLPPDGEDPHTIVCCTDTDSGRPAALFLDPIERTRLALRLADPGDASGQAARREVLRQVVTAEGGRWKSSRARRVLAEHGYTVTPRTARNDLAALVVEGLLVAHDEPGVRYYTPKRAR